MIKIKKYTKRKEALCFQFLEKEADFSCYHDPKYRDAYALNLEKSITYLLYENENIIGYVRAIEDYGFYIYICDLLVDASKRGLGYGKLLMEHIRSLYPKLDVFVMSDIDPYYIKQGYIKEGSIFRLPNRKIIAESDNMDNEKSIDSK